MADERPVMMQARQAFSCSLEQGVPFAVGAGDIFPATDEVVRRYPDNFRALRVRDSSVVRRPLPAHPGAETATAGPGERRSVTTAPAPARAPKKQPEPAAATASSEV